jgi:hypothetical protein
VAIRFRLIEIEVSDVTSNEKRWRLVRPNLVTKLVRCTGLLPAMMRLRLRAANMLYGSLRSHRSRTSVIMATSVDHENLDETASRKVKWGSYGPTVATNLASGVERWFQSVFSKVFLPSILKECQL